MTIATLVRARERIESATEGDFELDMEIARALGWTQEWQYWTDPVKPDARRFGGVPHFTGSIDAITNQIEARGWEWIAGSKGDGACGPRGDIRRAPRLATTPLALCYALLDRAIAKLGDDHAG